MGYAKRSFAIAAAANATVFTGAGGLFGILLKENTAVAAAGTLTVYDNTAASGSILATVRLGADGELGQPLLWAKGVKFGLGLTVAAAGADLTGTLLIGSAGGLRALPFAGADLLLLTGARNLDSILAAETAGAAAEWRMYDALSATGTPFAGASPAADETMKIDFGAAGVAIGTGLFYDQQGGASSGAAYVF